MQFSIFSNFSEANYFNCFAMQLLWMVARMVLCSCNVVTMVFSVVARVPWNVVCYLV